MKKRPALLAISLLASALAHAQEPKMSQEDTEKAVQKNIVKSAPIPLDGLVAAKDKNGNDVIVSTNGRYVLKGYLLDIYTIPASLAGIPALSIPCGFGDSGLPVGLQLMAPAFMDELILGAAMTFQDRTRFHEVRP